MKERPRTTSDTHGDGQARFRLTVRGQVQGVGFRPYVYRLALRMNLVGHVSNDAAGATIEVQGTPAVLEVFGKELLRQLPPLAQIVDLKREDIPVLDEREFVIRQSDKTGAAEAHVTVDVATCDDCLREMFDLDDRRYRYPFINCTNCGPRYTIVRGIPYDRPNTTMSTFAMCGPCRKEYEDPLDRRFHAQPIACPTCGPKVWLADAAGKTIDSADPIRDAASMLRAGRILAIKGLGGFHLACLAGSDDAVALLRQRKHRDHKPFAVMASDMAAIERVAEVPDDARKVLVSSARPIVLLPQRQQSHVSRFVAPGTNTYGIMLPYTPVHHLLLAEGLDLLIMTSGNLCDEPICKDNDEAVQRLAGIADAYLLHDRDIQRRVDDSVVQARGDRLMMLRRSRGYVPRPIPLVRSQEKGSAAQAPWAPAGRPPGGGPTPASPDNLPMAPEHESHGSHRSHATSADAAGGAPGTGHWLQATGHSSGTRPSPLAPRPSAAILAVGPELKNTICLLRSDQAVLSEHVGDLTNTAAYRHFLGAIEHLEALLEIKPRVVAHDLHPMYMSTQYARQLASVRLVGVQHHFAHVVSCMAEHGLDEPVIGIAADGTGYGDDGAIWGCEIFRAERTGYTRLGHLRYFPLPGGDAAARQAVRPALAVLHEIFGAEAFETSLAWQLDPALRDALRQTLEHKASTVVTSSLGRLFDAAACLVGVASENHFEGQAPMALEAAITADDEYYPHAVEHHGRRFESGLPADDQRHAGGHRFAGACWPDRRPVP